MFSTMEIDEVPGALERPAGCAVRIFEEDDGYRVVIPARGASPVMWLATIGLTVVLCAWLFMGVMLVVTGKPVFILAGIMNHGLTPSMYKYRFLLGGAVFAALSFGAAALFSMIRQNTLRERIVFDRYAVEHVRSAVGLRKVAKYPVETVRAFVVRRPPEGLSPGRLILVCQGEEAEIGEYVRHSDREWLCSVCNNLLRSR